MSKPAFLILLRKVLAGFVIFFFFIIFAWDTRLFPDLTGLASLQAGPALLKGNLAFLIMLAALTFLAGRIYCSLLCPLGICQDLVSKARKGKKFRPLPEMPWLRYGILALFFASLSSGILFLFELLDPYSSFGRIAALVIGPLLAFLNNALASAAQFIDLSFFSVREIAAPGWPALLVALVSLILLLAFAIKYGRVWCNFCPVGTCLGLASGKALFRIRLDRQKCVSCGLCQKTCKTGCININEGKIDNNRCVVCLDCVAVCPKQALVFSGPQKKKEGTASPVNSSKRVFLQSLLPALVIGPALPGAVKAAEAERINRPDIIPEHRSTRPREIPLTPPGAKGLAHFKDKCIGCQLCVNNCPNQVLASTLTSPGLLQPGMTYELGYCRPNCVRCGEICPTGAIAKISLEEKKGIAIGQASVNTNLCVVRKDKVQCTACHRICPQKAISLVEEAELAPNLKVPFVDIEKCTGCGACEYICPAMPLAAISVNAFRNHKKLETS